MSPVHLVDLAFEWPENAENLFAQQFAEALKCSKAVIVLQDRESTQGLVRLIGQYGLTEEEINLAVLPHFDLRQESLSKLAHRLQHHLGIPMDLLMHLQKDFEAFHQNICP